MPSKGILIVSFGTACSDTREKTIDHIAARIRSSFPECRCYYAFLSRFIRTEIEKQEAMHIPDIEEAMTQMKNDGIRHVRILPILVIPGMEYERLLAGIRTWEPYFLSIRCAAPLLSAPEDQKKFARLLSQTYASIPAEEAIVFSGHGSRHSSTDIYADLNRYLSDSGRSHIFVGTLKAHPDIRDILCRLAQTNCLRVHLIPLMLSAGTHVTQDLAGDRNDSWKSLLIQQGYQVSCHLSGLLEYDFVCQMFADHLQKIL